MNISKSSLLDTYIIGAGPAGMSAALQLSRYPLSMKISEQNSPGGLLQNANCVENMPGHPGKLSGPELISRFEMQLKENNIEILREKVSTVRYSDDFFTIETSQGFRCAKTVIAATGTRSRSLTGLPVPGNVKSRIMSDYISLQKTRGKTIAVIGAGDAAFDQSLQLSRSNNVIILNRTNRVRCLPLLFDAAQLCSNITYYSEFTVTNIELSRMNTLRIQGYNQRDAECVIHADYILSAIGREPEKGFISSQLKPLLQDLISQNRFFYAGDVKNNRFRQAAIAAGDGVLAAMSIWDYLGPGDKGYIPEIEKKG